MWDESLIENDAHENQDDRPAMELCHLESIRADVVLFLLQF